MGSSVTKENASLLNEAITSILNTTLTNIANNGVNTVQLSQSAKIVIGPNAVVQCKSGVNINQSINANLKFITNFTTTDSTDISSALQNDLEQSNSQIMKITREMFASIGLDASDTTSVDMKNIVSNLISNLTETNVLNNILNSNISVQTGEIEINGKISGDKCATIDQDMQIVMFTESLADTAIQTATSNSVINRMVNDSKQSIEKKESGLATVLFWLAILGIVAYLLIGKLGSTSTMKIIVILVVVVALALGAAYMFKIAPFKPKPQYWGVALDANKMSTYTCKEYDDSESGQFSTENECNNAVRVCKTMATCSMTDASCKVYPSQYWGILPDDKSCAQFAKVTTTLPDKKTQMAPYYNKEQCERCIVPK